MEPLLLKHYSKKQVSLIQKQIKKDYVSSTEINTQDNNTKSRSIFHNLKTKLCKLKIINIIEIFYLIFFNF